MKLFPMVRAKVELLTGCVLFRNAQQKFLGPYRLHGLHDRVDWIVRRNDDRHHCLAGLFDSLFNRVHQLLVVDTDLHRF